MKRLGAYDWRQLVDASADQQEAAQIRSLAQAGLPPAAIAERLALPLRSVLKVLSPP